MKLTLLLLLAISRCYSQRTREVHAFYYLWYGTPEHDGEWKHWNHEVLPHWTKSVNDRYPEIGSRFTPPHRIHSPFYPLSGPYSSQDESVIRHHFYLMHASGIDVVVLSWWGQCSNPSSSDTQGVCTDDILPTIFRIADELNTVKIAFHLEPYAGRNVSSLRSDIMYLHGTYGHHQSLYRMYDRPLYYIYDSYHISVNEWSRLLNTKGDLTIRNSLSDGVFLGLWLHNHHGRELRTGGFDGVYSYFASDGFSYGSTSSHWNTMTAFCETHALLCSLSVGPGYQDDKIRPWNIANTKHRGNGEYYRRMWNNAVSASPQVVSYYNLSVTLCR